MIGGTGTIGKAVAKELSQDHEVLIARHSKGDLVKEYFPGFTPVPASQVALAYRKSIEGTDTGKVYRVHDIS